MPCISVYCVTTSSRFVGSMENYRSDAHQLIPLKHTVAQLKSRFLFHSLSKLWMGNIENAAQFVYRNVQGFLDRCLFYIL